MQIPDRAPAGQFGAADLPGRIGEAGALEIPQNQGGGDAALERIQTNRIGGSQAEGSGIIANAARGAEGGAGGVTPFTNRFDCLNGLSAGTAGELGAEAETGAGFAIDQFMEGEFVGDAALPGDISTIRGGGIKGRLGGTEQ